MRLGPSGLRDTTYRSVSVYGTGRRKAAGGLLGRNVYLKFNLPNLRHSRILEAVDLKSIVTSPSYTHHLAADSELPTYGSGPSPSRPTAALPTPWAMLTLLGHPTLSRTIPTFLEGSNITGSVKLNLRSPDAIKSVVVFVRGDLIISGDPDERTNFFRMRKFLWTPSMGDPRAPGASTDNWEGKLKGEYDWPISITLPELATSPDGERRFHLPHTFSDRALRSCIEYYFHLRITRGKLRPDDDVITSFGLFSMGQPSRPSQLRQLVYQSSAEATLVDILGPHSDTEVFGERAVNAKCTVFLAKPLCYTRSTSIPCAMTFETEDSQVADVLASIKSTAVYLQRTVRCLFAYSSTSIIACGQATWWPSADAAHARNPAQRHLMGEIHLRKDLHPSSTIKDFQVEYAVAVFPPAAVAFKPQGACTGPLITQSVKIVTRFAQGVRPKPSTVPVDKSADSHVDRYYESVADLLPKFGAVVKLWA
ncbi:hypothetical protein K438DRAFT_1821775 [Mycena galopus ATCC 62051]|nr:hypothetical protein K438DRAFT_1821775 [Mycena galopus ATCC 62051]